MLLFAGCNDNHTAPRNNQRHKHAKVEYNEYAKDDVYIAKSMYVAKGKYIEYAKDGVYVAEGKYGKYAKEDASVKEGHNEPLAKEGNNKPLAKNGNRAGYGNEPLATRAIGHICVCVSGLQLQNGVLQCMRYQSLVPHLDDIPSIP
jgi:hypothetical protein